MTMDEDAWQTDGRWRRAKVSIQLLSDILAGGVPAGVTSDAPRDLRVIGVHEINTGPIGFFDFIVWSSTFDPLPMTNGRLHDPIPPITFIYRRNDTHDH